MTHRKKTNDSYNFKIHQHVSKTQSKTFRCFLTFTNMNKYSNNFTTSHNFYFKLAEVNISYFLFSHILINKEMKSYRTEEKNYFRVFHSGYFRENYSRHLNVNFNYKFLLNTNLILEVQQRL